MPPTTTQIKQLVSAARKAAGIAYAPYSKFQVGSAILTKSGNIYTGCNVENASYGLCICAERTAIFNAVASGEKKLNVECVVVYTSTEKATAPCGACRQVIFEFGPKARVISTCRGNERIDRPITELLPDAFGPEDLL